MRKKWCLLILLAVAMFPFQVSIAKQSGHYKSALGFEAVVPDGWLLVDSKTLKENPNLLGTLPEEKMKGIDSHLLNVMKGKIKSGEVDMFFNKFNTHLDFSDNVNAQKYIGVLPANDDELSVVCSQLESVLAQIFGRKVTMEACELNNIGKNNAFYVKAEGALPGSVMMQYQFQADNAVLLIVTATAHNESVERVHKQLREFVHSISFSKTKSNIVQ